MVWNFVTKNLRISQLNWGLELKEQEYTHANKRGIAEKFNRMTMDGVRAMLRGLQPTFWAEALLTFVNAKNRCEHKLTSPLTPLKYGLGSNRLYDILEYFDFLAYVHIPQIKRNKLQPRAKLGILVGYAL
ncbi:hypothetical protein AVEN_117218-1 [Araneus ventricosus]|uniref:Retroviral polymerase SH3-like domain-containing protein n=1 Tax=Araneus ventricosus TaxID=182803 RepID=A0A4Y2AZG7_ARAVE|nr:hypothetical protein AVEN_117218-1 [Araneus ventricosus]